LFGCMVRLLKLNNFENVFLTGEATTAHNEAVEKP